MATVSILFLELTLFLTLTHAFPETPKAPEPALNFVMLGDWGGKPDPPYYTNAEKKIAASMGKKAQDIGSKFTVALGDNFYYDGVKDVNDKRFQETFEVSELHLLINYASITV